MKETKYRGVIIFIIGLIVGFGIAQLFTGDFKGGDEDIQEVSVEEITDEEAGEEDALALISQGENTIVVSDQPSGMSVVTSMISLEQSGWVAVHESLDGEPGVILGARRFPEGKYFGETVELLRATDAEMTYLVVLHADDGDNEFDFKKEVAVRDILGNLVGEEFFATSQN